MIENKKQLYEKRKKILLQTCNIEESEYVPSLLVSGNALLSYAGMTYYDIEKDEEKYRQSLHFLFDRLNCDATTQAYVGTPRAHEALDGRTETYLLDDGVTPVNLEEKHMRGDEYPSLIKDPFAYINDVLVPRKYPELFNKGKKAAVEALKIVVEESVNYTITGPFAKNIQILQEEFGLIRISNSKARLIHPLDMFFDFFRGFSGILTDMRRRPQEVKEGCEVLWETMCNHFETLPEIFPFVAYAPHIPSYISTKQFYEFYWPYAQKMFTNIANNGGKTFIGLEGKWSPVLECFNELPKGSMVTVCDEDDIFECKKKIGAMQTVSGGLHMLNVRFKNKDKCIDHAKRVIDECAPGGGFIFSGDKGATCAGDVNEVLIDVYNFAHEYGMNKY